eukprot:3912500-Pyramimonas_sp.AAC.1
MAHASDCWSQRGLLSDRHDRALGFPDADIPHQLLLDIDTSICHQLWTCASKHHGGEGLQHGVDSRSYRKLPAYLERMPQGVRWSNLVLTIATGATWARQR